MFSIFEDVTKQIRVRKEHPTIESGVFHAMKVAMVTTVLACTLVTAKTYIGNNINCVSAFEKQEHKAIETYCFISTTFSMINLTESESPYQGVGPMGSSTEEDLVRHAYYQWVPLVLALQAAVLYFPRWLWKAADRNKFKAVLMDLDMVHVNADMSKTIAASASYMARSLNTHGGYAICFLLCEIIGFSVALGNLFFTDSFLGGNFFLYGRGALSYMSGSITDMNNPLNVVFPKITKCTWMKFGPTGSIQSFDALCVLPLNIVNEKTYVLLWVVYITTVAVTAAVVVYHVALLFLSGVRNRLVNRNLHTLESRGHFRSIQNKMDYGDWFFVHHLSTRMVLTYFDEWMKQLAEEIEK